MSDATKECPAEPDSSTDSMKKNIDKKKALAFFKEMKEKLKRAKTKDRLMRRLEKQHQVELKRRERSQAKETRERERLLNAYVRGKKKDRQSQQRRGQ